MRRSIATVSAAVLGLALITPGAAHADPAPTPVQKSGPTPAQPAVAAGVPKAPLGSKPAGPNPYLADLPAGAHPDYAGWRNYLKAQSSSKIKARLKLQNLKAQGLAATPPAVVVDEDELDGTSGGNDSPVNAQRVTGFGTGAKQYSRIRVLGSLDNEPIDAVDVPAAPEDDGSIPLAGDTGISGLRNGAVIDSQIGDGPHGRLTGDGSNDFDFFKVTARAGQVLTAATATPDGPLDTVLELWSADGTLLALNDDSGVSLDSRISFPVVTAGDYYVSVAAYGGLPGDPFDSGSGTGVGDPTPPSQGPYTLSLSSVGVDTDFYAIKLKPGDVLGASVAGSASYLTVYDTTPREVHGSEQDASVVYPMASPLPAGGNAVTDYVATKAGWHYIGVAHGSGAYDITVEAYRPPLEGTTPVQTVFLDFDGARVNTGVFGGPGNRDLSPFAAFITRWGLTRADEDALIDAVVAGVTENLKKDMVASGLNSRFKLKVLNSKDDPDPWGKPNVSRIVVGGTVAESGVDTIGISQSIDPGNFETSETALVLLDYLSDPAGEDSSLNTYITPASDKVSFLGHALGNVIAHEGGHFFGNFHTDNADDRPNVMDAGGGGFGTLFGVGPDGIGGTADDIDVDFGDDRFIPAEGFAGTEDTLGRIAFGVTS
ncbi:MAG TPA: DVUA0089 family protein [Actinoplanes sp.]